MSMHRTLVAKKKRAARPLTHAQLPQTSPTWRGPRALYRTPPAWPTHAGSPRVTAESPRVTSPCSHALGTIGRRPACPLITRARSSPEPAQDARAAGDAACHHSCGTSRPPLPPHTAFSTLHGRAPCRAGCCDNPLEPPGVWPMPGVRGPNGRPQGLRAAHAARGRPQNLKRSTIAEMLSLLPRLYASSVSRFAAFSASCGAPAAGHAQQLKL